MIFAGPVLVYAIMCVFVIKLTKIIPKRAVITIGILMLGSSLFFVSRSAPLPNSAYCIIVGTLITGVGMPMFAIPVLPELIEAIEASDLNYNSDNLTDAITSIFATANGIGETLGPFLNSILVK